MAFFRLFRPQPGRSRGPNTLAGLIGVGSFGLLALNFQTTPAGADADALQNQQAATAILASQAPLPPPLPASADEADDVDPQTSMLHSMQESLQILETGCERLKQIPAYTATFYKQEHLDGELGDGQVTLLKLRHAPFSVYMKWLVGDKGREVMYVAGDNDDRMIVKLGGWKARLPALRIEPDGPMALAESRHPITECGLLHLTQTVLEHRRRDVARKCDGVTFRKLPDQQFDNRDCYCYMVEYSSPEYSPTYRKSVQFVDKEWQIPVWIRNYAWPEASAAGNPEKLDDTTLIEFYSYSNVNFNERLADADFDRTNSEYRLR